METPFYRSTGISFVIGSILAILTMALHPSGGSIEHILEISTSIQLIHSLAICCLPLLLFGFYGLTHKLLDNQRLSILALIIVLFGLIAAMLAALINGLALPSFLSQYSDNLEENALALESIANYGFALNRGFDYIFIIALCATTSLYSICIIQSKKLPRWIGYIGLILFMLMTIGAVTSFSFTNLIGFRLVVFGIAGWMLSSGVALIKNKP